MEATTFTRRHAFKIAGLAGAAVALRNTAAPAQEAAAADRVLPKPKALPQGAGFYRLHVGQIEVTIISDGGFPLTPYPTIGSNATQAEVEGLLKENFIDPSSLTGQVNTLTVRRGQGPVTVVDTGSGKLFGPAAGFMKQNLVASGVRPEEIANVIFTHLHPDHVGGALTEDGKLTFPNAKHWAHQKEIDFWKNPDLSKSGVPEAMRAGMAMAAQKFASVAGAALNAFDGDDRSLLPGIDAVLTGGHTPGHCAVRVHDGKDMLFFVSDLIVQSVLVPAHPEWWVGFDTDMKATVEVRQNWFANIEAVRTPIAGSHLPFPGVGHLRKAGRGYEFVPAPWRWA